MGDKRIYYRELKKYKYQLMTEYSHSTDLEINGDIGTIDDYVYLSKNGELD